MDNNESINNEVSFSDSQTEIQISSDSGVQTNDSNLESQLTESRIMEGMTSQSTPTLVKKESSSDMMSVILNQLEEMNSNFNGINSRFDNNDIKLNEIKSEFNCKFDAKFEVQNNKFDELKNQINEINERFENTNEIIETSFNRV